jgi:hypothetical protein
VKKQFWKFNPEMALQLFQRDNKSVAAGGVAAAYARTGYVDSAFQWLDKA